LGVVRDATEFVTKPFRLDLIVTGLSSVSDQV